MRDGENIGSQIEKKKEWVDGEQGKKRENRKWEVRRDRITTGGNVKCRKKKDKIGAEKKAMGMETINKGKDNKG